MDVKAVLAAAALAACTQGELGPPTGATCPPDSTLTYESFAAPFMASYCTECHSSALPPDERQGAPVLHDFDTLYGIVAVWQHVDETAAAGPDAVNTLMPPHEPTPTLAERYQLGDWLACGMPE